MTLKQKFFDIYTSYYKKSNELDKMVEVADDYAIEFAEWCDDNYFKNGKGNSNWSDSMDWDDNEKFTTSELLEMFKKEKGL
jgi:hypothetical protein